MARLIVNIFFLVVLAVFIAMNVTNVTAINLFGKVIPEISVVAVILLSIVLGVIYSFLFYLTNYLHRIRKERIREQETSSREKEKELKKREKDMDKVLKEKTAPEQEPAFFPDPLEGSGQSQLSGQKKKAGIFGRKKN